MSTAIVEYGISSTPDGHKFVPFRFVALWKVFDGAVLTISSFIYVTTRKRVRKVGFNMVVFPVALNALSYTSAALNFIPV